MKRIISRLTLPEAARKPLDEGIPVDDVVAWLNDAPSKGDLRGWSGCPPFHLDKMPDDDKKKT